MHCFALARPQQALLLLGQHQHQAAARRNRRRARTAVVPLPKGHLHQRLARRIDRDETLSRKLRHHLPLATAVVERKADLRQKQATIARAQRQNVVSLGGRYRAARELGRPHPADDLAIVQPQQIHPLGADRIRGLIIGVEPNGEWADHSVCFFCL